MIKLNCKTTVHFLGSMRGNLGCNDIHTALQFVSAYKKLLVGTNRDVNAGSFNVTSG